MIREATEGAGGFLLNQIGGTFLSPSSTLSIYGLVVTLAIALVSIACGRPRRPLRARVLVRVLFPRRMIRTRSGRLDGLFFLLSVGGAGALFAWAIVAAEWARGGVGALFGSHAPLLSLSAGLASLVATIMLFLAYEFAYWVDHWAKHRCAILWAFHKVHHDAESLSLLTNFRVHPIDTVIFYNLVAIVTGAAGAALDAVMGKDVGIVSIGTTNILVMASAVALTHFQHSHFWIGAGFGGTLLGPAHHQIHHSADPAHHNRNFGSSLALWDRLFGTYHAPAARRGHMRFGSGTATTHGLGEALWRPFAEVAGIVLPATPPPRPARSPPSGRCE